MDSIHDEKEIFAIVRRIEKEIYERKPDLKMIKRKKCEYGNNFPLMALLMGCTEIEAVERMYKMKIARIYGNEAHADSWIDAVNYYWISTHYQEYLTL